MKKRLLLPFLLAACALNVCAETIPLASVVRFNTVCSTCHEGECSGRMSFHTGSDAARNHMQRYLGSIDETEAKQLFAMLRHTKEQCTHYPLAGAVTVGHTLSAEQLVQWHNPQQGGYFIPLGQLNKGGHRLQMTFSKAANVKAKVTDRQFEPLAEDSSCPQQNTLEIRFDNDAGPHYLTINGQGELHSLKLETVN